jgi:hypothetical protein
VARCRLSGSRLLCPTFISTPPFTPLFATPGLRPETAARIALGRPGEGEDLRCYRLPRLGASVLMTGTSFTIDGGWTAN